MANEDDALKLAMGVANTDPLGGVKQGMQLAQAQNNLQQQRMDLEAKKSEIEDHKFNAMLGDLKTIAISSPDVAKRLVPIMEKRANARGSPYAEGFLDNYKNDQQSKADLLNAVRAVQNDPTLTAEEKKEGMLKLQDTLGAPEFIKTLSESYKTKVSEEAADKRLKLTLASQERTANRATDAATAAINKEGRKTSQQANIRGQDLFLTKFGGEDALKSIEALENGELAADMRNPVAAGQVATVAAKVFQPGKLSDSDVRNLTKDETLVNKFKGLQERYINGNGDLTDKDRKDFQEFFEAFRKKALTRIERTARDASHAAAAAYGADEDAVFESVMPMSLRKGGAANKAPATALPPADLERAKAIAMDPNNPRSKEFQAALKKQGIDITPKAQDIPADQGPQNKNKEADIMDTAAQMLNHGAKQGDVLKFMSSVLGREATMQDLNLLKGR